MRTCCPKPNRVGSLALFRSLAFHLLPFASEEHGSTLAASRTSMTMKLQVQGDTLSIGGVKELNAANAGNFRDQVRAAMSESLRNIEIDLSQATFLDSCAVGALISLHKTACSRHGLVRLMNPATPVQQILELTRLHRLFEIVQN